ncbi:hypothetical protein, partial [Ruminiclostridium hungatei]|uniref:hypothetical protein n=1 Tax=Ruminiclostridium hungatei TaxID=48256 RepID=UPI0013FD9DC8
MFGKVAEGTVVKLPSNSFSVLERVFVAISSVTTSYTYNEQNRLVSTVQQSGRETVTEKYSYDSNGNTI